MIVVHFQNCYTNSTEETIHGSIWKNQQPATVFLHNDKNHKYWIVMRHYTCYRSFTNNKVTFFQKTFLQAMSDYLASYSSVPPQHKHFSHAWLGVAEYKGHLLLRCSYIQFNGCRTNSRGMWQWYGHRAWWRSQQYLADFLRLHPLQWTVCCSYM